MGKNKHKHLKIEDIGVVILKVYAGSRAYGTNITEEMARDMVAKYGGDIKDYVSDVDIRGIFIPFPKYAYGKEKIDIFEDPNDEDTVYYSLGKYLELALEANPNILELVFADENDVIFQNEIGKELRELRFEFVSTNAFSRYVSYSSSQLKRARPQDEGSQRNEKRQRIIEMAASKHDLKVDMKNMSHLVRLRKTGNEILQFGNVIVKRPDWKLLLDIRNGEYSYEQILEMVDELDKNSIELLEKTTIRQVPDFDKINKWAMSAYDRTFGEDETVGVFPGSSLKFLPEDYEMVDKTSLFLIGNPLTRSLNRSQANGLCIPYKDWFTGLRTFSEFKFADTTIEHIHKFVDDARACNPRHIDAIFAGEDKFLFKHPLADELFKVLRTLPTTKKAYYTAYGYITGNMREMEKWEAKKKAHSELAEAVKAAKAIKRDVWDEKFAAWDKKKAERAEEFKKAFDDLYSTVVLVKDEHALSTWREELNRLNGLYRESMEELRIKKSNLTNEFKKWEELSSKKGNMPYYPPMEGYDNHSSSMIGKFSYDTPMAASLTHVVRMFTELMSTGTIQDSRAYEREMYAIENGKYKSFEEFKTFMDERLVELAEARDNSKLGEHNYDEVQEFVIDFIKRFHKTL